MGCPKAIEPPKKAVSEHPLQKQAVPLDSIAEQVGILENGVYVDSTNQFSLPVSDDWKVEQGNFFGERRLKLSHKVEDYAVELWRLSGRYTYPAAREDCLWAFVDEGLYSEWSEGVVNVATCYPVGSNTTVIFVYMYQTAEYTWQLEGHVSMDVLVEGERLTREIIQQIEWLDDESVQNKELQ